MPKSFYLTIDVDWIPGSEESIPDILRLCRDYDLSSTFFTVGAFAQRYPDAVRRIHDAGHEIGTHGWEHGLLEYEDYRTAPAELQRTWIRAATKAVHAVTGQTPVSFRSPNLWCGPTMLRVLAELGYRFDSSVPAGRFDAGIGQQGFRTQYFSAPRDPYYPSLLDLGKPGDGPILEVPPSAFVFPFNMSGLRVFGTRALKWAAGRLARRTDTMVFYLHPAELVIPSRVQMPQGTPARHLRNTGPERFVPLRDFIEHVLGLGYLGARIDSASAPRRHAAHAKVSNS